jgi:hypothetical protein
MVGALELRIFDEDGAELAPVFRLRRVSKR